MCSYNNGHIYLSIIILCDNVADCFHDIVFTVKSFNPIKNFFTELGLVSVHKLMIGPYVVD